MDTRPPAPSVVFWFRVYCAAMLAMYAIVTVCGAGVLAFYPRLAAASEGRYDALVLLVYGLLMAGIGLCLAAAYLAGLVLGRRPWVWVYDIVLIAIGLSSPCCLPASLPLLVFWVKPQTQAFFGRATR